MPFLLLPPPKKKKKDREKKEKMLRYTDGYGFVLVAFFLQL